MRTRTALVSALVAVTALGSTAPALAGKPKPKPKPKPFTQTVSYSDATPDPSGNAQATEAEHCDGLVAPKGDPIVVRVPGKGLLDVSISGFQGDWSLQINDAKGELLTGADVNPPETETAGYTFSRATTVQVLPCNLAGTPTATVKIAYSPS